MTVEQPAPRSTKRMYGTLIAIALVAVAAIVFLKRGAQMPQDQASTLIREGAPVIDVRTPGEFKEEAIPGAINIPLDELTAAVPQRFPDKGQPLLLHCLSGGRSGTGAQRLRSLGYTNVHNLGSFSRARSLVQSAKGR